MKYNEILNKILGLGFNIIEEIEENNYFKLENENMVSTLFINDNKYRLTLVNKVEIDNWDEPYYYEWINEDNVNNKFEEFLKFFNKHNINKLKIEK